jgi:hypothetical protein
MSDKPINFAKMISSRDTSLLNVEEEVGAVEEQLRAEGLLPDGATVKIWDVDEVTQFAMFEHIKHIKRSFDSALIVCGYSEAPKLGTTEAVRYLAVAGLAYRFLADIVGYDDDAEEADALGHALALHLAESVVQSTQEKNRGK